MIPDRPITKHAVDGGVPVLIIDDHELVGTSLMLNLQAEGLRAQWFGPHGRRQVLSDIAMLPPGLAVVDLDLGSDPIRGRMDGVKLIRPLVETNWRVLVLSGILDRAWIGAAFAAGASAMVPKRAPFPTLLAAVRAILAGHTLMPPERRAELIAVHEERVAEHQDLVAKLQRLSQREREVLVQLARGKRAQAVADQFVVSVATVRTQVRAILKKLEVGSQLEAVALYRRALDR